MFNIVEGTRRRALLLALCLSFTAGALTIGAPEASAQSRGAAAVSSPSVLAPGAGFDGRLQGLVGRLQQRLARLGYRPGPIDGLFGPLTAEAVRRLQSANGVAVDGIVGPVTRRALRAQAGVSVTRVRRAQRQLRVLGRRPGPVDGVFGARTVRALKRFQDAAGITGVARLSDAMIARLTRAARDARSQQPVESNPTPPTTNEAPSATTEASPATTEIPPATSEIPSATTEAPPATGEIPPATSEIPSATTEAPPATGEIPPATSEIPPVTTETEVPPATAGAPSAAIPTAGITTSPAAPTTGQTPAPTRSSGPEPGSIALVVLATAAAALLLGWGVGRPRRRELPFRSNARNALLGLLSLGAVAVVLVPLLSGIDATCGTGCDPAPGPLQLAYDAALVATLALTAALLAVWLIGRGRTRRARTPEARESPPLFVIVIPARNLELVIGETVRHVLELPYRPLIAMVVDDGSTDGTRDMARSAAAGDPRLVVVDRPGCGRAAALDYAYRALVGARSSTAGTAPPGDVVFGVLDAGLWLAPDALAAVAPYFADPAVGAVQLPVRADNARDGFLPQMQDIDAVANAAFLQQGRDLDGSAGLAASGHFVRLTALRTLGDAPWTRAAAADGDVAGQLVARGWEVRFCAASCVAGPALMDARELVRRRARRMQQRHARWSDLSALRRGGRVRAARRIESVLQPFAPLAVGAVLGYTVLSLAALAGVLPLRQTLVEALTPSGALEGAMAVALACGPVALLTLVVLASATAYGGRAAAPMPLWAAPGMLLAYAAYTCWWGLPAISRTLAGTGTRDAVDTQRQPAAAPADRPAGQPTARAAAPVAAAAPTARRVRRFARTRRQEEEVAHR